MKSTFCLETTKICPLCEGVATLTYVAMKGYIEETRFDIFECKDCLVSFADPLYSDENVYKYIYEQVEIAYGYERYFRFSRLVKQVDNPLAMLCAAESGYWAVREALQQYFYNKDIKILEIGSGLGYLTYSLNKEGYCTVGVDISNEAISRSCKLYGDYYEAGDIFVISGNRKKQYDCVIMTELIEHVVNPIKFIECALSMLKDGGKLIITTPNKSNNVVGTIWATDAPCVHLWWFSEKSIAGIAAKLGRKCEFVDFTKFTKRFYESRDITTMDQIQSNLPRLTKDGKVTETSIDRSIKSRFLSIKMRYVLSYIRRRLKQKITSKRSCEMCAVLS